MEIANLLFNCFCSPNCITLETGSIKLKGEILICSCLLTLVCPKQVVLKSSNTTIGNICLIIPK